MTYGIRDDISSIAIVQPPGTAMVLELHGRLRDIVNAINKLEYKVYSIKVDMDKFVEIHSLSEKAKRGGK